MNVAYTEVLQLASCAIALRFMEAEVDFCETATTFVSDPCVGAPTIDLEAEMTLGIIGAYRRPVGLQAPAFPARIDPGSLGTAITNKMVHLIIGHSLVSTRANDQFKSI